MAKAVATSGVPRDQLFLTTKQLGPTGDVDAAYAKVVDSVKKLGGDSGYIDLMLSHSPHSGPAGRKNLWQALERAHQEGKCKSIGVSNWGVGQIEELKSFAKVWPPHVNQIEVSSTVISVLTMMTTAVPSPQALCTDGMTSCIHGTNSVRLWSTAARMALLSRHTVRWCGRRRTMIPLCSPLRRSTTRVPDRSWCDTASRRSGVLCQRVIRPAAFKVMLRYLAGSSTSTI